MELEIYFLFGTFIFRGKIFLTTLTNQYMSIYIRNSETIGIDSQAGSSSY